VIAQYFSEIYKRPDHMQDNLNMGVQEDDEMIDEMINTTALFNLDDIIEAIKQSNFNKGLGPDCFDGNVLNKNEQLS
jgi:hypothetical protein